MCLESINGCFDNSRFIFGVKKRPNEKFGQTVYE